MIRLKGERIRSDKAYTGRQTFEAGGDSEGSLVERHPDAAVHFSIIGEGKCKACGHTLHILVLDAWTDDAEMYDNHSKRCNYAYKAGE